MGMTHANVARKLTLAARKNDLERISEEIKAAATAGRSHVRVKCDDTDVIASFLRSDDCWMYRVQQFINADPADRGGVMVISW